MDDDDGYRSRDRDLRGYIEFLLSEFAEAYERTDPRRDGTAPKKDHRAFSTLSNASALVDQVAGWALDHVCGLSIAGIRMLPLQPSSMRPGKGKEHPEYLKVRDQADSHVHEAAGSEVYLQAPSSPAARRLVLRNLVFAGAGGFPHWLREELVEALDALESGTVMPLLQQGDKAKGMEPQIARARLRIVCLIRFRSSAYGTTVEAERDFVANYMGKDPRAIRKWEQRLPASCLGSLEVDRAILFATNAASHVAHARSLAQRGEEVPEHVASMAEHHEQRYGTPALETAVLVLRRLEGWDQD